MIRKFTLPAVVLVLGYGLWASANFKEIAAGVALFMFGMVCLEDGFKAFTGGTLESMLRRFTNRLWKGITFGVVSTTLMQSSTLVSLVTISFVSAEMISLAAGIAVILGANIGTTTGAWLIAGLGLKVNISAYALPMLVFGVVFVLNRDRVVKGVGWLVLGAGFLFLGIHFMKEGFEAFQSSFDLSVHAMSGVLGVLLFTLIGVVMTVIMQSSHATLLIIITALSAGQVTYENALALAIGANLGSAITTGIGGLAANLGGKRLAAAHVVFNVVIAIVGMATIVQIAWLVDHVAALLGIAENDYLLKLALFHTLYNVMGVAMFAPFVKQLESFLTGFFTVSRQTAASPRYLYRDALETPATAVAAVHKETRHLLDNAYGIFAHGLSLRRDAIVSGESLSEAIKYTRKVFPIDVEVAYEEKIKGLYSRIVEFIAEARTVEADDASRERIYALRQAGRDIVEAVKGMKHLHSNLSAHALSSNPAVRERYDAIRLQLATLLRELRHLSEEEGRLDGNLSLDALQVAAEKSNRQILDDLDEMIRHRRIAPTVATSIMNDQSYALAMSENLISAARALMPEEAFDGGLAGEIALSEEELSRIAQQ